MPESQLEKTLRLKIKALGGIAYKFTSPARKGVPDRIVVMQGLIVFVETKWGKNGLSVHQVQEHKRLRSLGQRVEVIKNIEELNNFLKTI